MGVLLFKTSFENYFYKKGGYQWLAQLPEFQEVTALTPLASSGQQMALCPKLIKETSWGVSAILILKSEKQDYALHLIQPRVNVAKVKCQHGL